MTLLLSCLLSSHLVLNLFLVEELASLAVYFAGGGVGFVVVLLGLFFPLEDLSGNIVKTNKNPPLPKRNPTPSPEAGQFGLWAALLR